MFEQGLVSWSSAEEVEVRKCGYEDLARMETLAHETTRLLSDRVDVRTATHRGYGADVNVELARGYVVATCVVPTTYCTEEEAAPSTPPASWVAYLHLAQHLVNSYCIYLSCTTTSVLGQQPTCFA
jgi:hypothetical protein